MQLIRLLILWIQSKILSVLWTIYLKICIYFGILTNTINSRMDLIHIHECAVQAINWKLNNTLDEGQILYMVETEWILNYENQHKDPDKI